MYYCFTNTECALIICPQISFLLRTALARTQVSSVRGNVSAWFVDRNFLASSGHGVGGGTSLATAFTTASQLTARC